MEPAMMHTPASMLDHSTSRMPETSMLTSGNWTAMRMHDAMTPIDPKISRRLADSFVAGLILALTRAQTPRPVRTPSETVLSNDHAILMLTNVC